MRRRDEVGCGLKFADVRGVVASTIGVDAVARRLGVSRNTARKYSRFAGVRIRPATARHVWSQRVTDADVEGAIRGPLSLRAAAAALGVTSPSLLARARYIGLPTDPAGRAALRGACS
ncbi:hypothetical protein PQI07_16270 [Methylobacterium sp. 092160098-2]|uniref:hypothetical protein n=1 Tax=Methylobacterium sp. 092160098-2 TaxID=3025129 RepID=UPI0023819D29|nr:hypothetical protein [Methylobacterium sp. 092160098-2]MDE4912237.1 hypothetical protein [Methylobacterium sp. 092160098-2]